MSLEAFAIGVAIIIWLVSNAVKGLRRLGTQLRGKNTRPGLEPEAVAETPPPFLPLPPPAPVRDQARAAEAVSPQPTGRAEATFREAKREEAKREEAAPPLFGSADDLVRAVILQEVLGPPLSRRSSAGPSAPPPA